MLPEYRYHAAVLNCFDSLTSIKTSDVEITRVMTSSVIDDKSIMSVISAL